MPVAFVIELHAPYARNPGRQYAGEDRLHTLTAQAFIPLLDLLGELQRHGLPITITVACSPIALEQWRDPVVNKHFAQWLEEKIRHHQAELSRFETEGDRHGAYLARFYLDWDRQILRSFTNRYQRNLVGRLQELVTAGIVVPLCAPAGYAILPLISQESIARAHIEHGFLYISRSLGRPEGLWLPDYAWRPGLEHTAIQLGLRYVVVAPNSLISGQLPGWIVARRLAAIGVDEELAQHCGSFELGYPGDPLYRDAADPGGHTAIGINAPQPYDPYDAIRRAQEHANHFITQLLYRLEQLPAESTIVIPIDARVWGSRWFEGPMWLQAVLTRCATDPRLRLTHPGTILSDLRVSATAALRACAWPADQWQRWQSSALARYWQAIADAETRFVELVKCGLVGEGLRERVLNQAVRELLLAEMRDWADDPDEMGWQRHLNRFDQLLLLARQDSLSATDLFALEQIEQQDAPFSVLNYRLFAKS